jgi:hypothetical protein
MQESNTKIDIPEDITNLANIVEFIDYKYNMHIEWACYLPADKWMLTSVISSYLANLESPEALLNASKATLWDLVKAEYMECLSELGDEELAEEMQSISE